jgi:hypothetical protein
MPRLPTVARTANIAAHDGANECKKVFTVESSVELNRDIAGKLACSNPRNTRICEKLILEAQAKLT